MKLYIIIMLMALLVTSFASACKEVYETNEIVVIEDDIEYYGLDADCNISIYANNTLVQTAWMVQNGLAYNYSAGTLPPDTYVAGIACNRTNSSFLGECKFIVEGDENMYIALAIILSVVIFVLFIVGRNIDFMTVGYSDSVGQVTEVPLGSYMIFLLAGWLTTALVNVGIKAIEVNNIGLVNTFDGVYRAVVYTMWILTVIWFIMFLYFVFRSLAEYAERSKYG